MASKLRYNIKERFLQKSWKERNAIMRFVKNETQKNNVTIYRHINERSGGTKHNNINILNAFAAKLDCTVDDLINLENK